MRYARVQEGPPGGGSHTIVKARSGGALAIPVHPSLFTGAGVNRYGSPRQVPDLFLDRDSKGLPLLRNSVTGEVFYLLRPQVKIPAKRFMRDGMGSAVETLPSEYRNTMERVVLHGQ